LSASTLALTSLVFLFLGFVLGFLGWAITLLLNISTKDGFKLRKDNFSVRITFSLILSAGFSLGIAVISIILAGIWWSVGLILIELTPGTLALFSIIIGPAPLLITALASTLGTILGCQLDASGTRNCRFLGIDVGPLLHALFMTYWLAFLTMGLAFAGLIGSSIWASLKLF
jgi:hypothetical protein